MLQATTDDAEFSSASLHRTSPTKIKDHKVAASKDNPEFIVETDEGKRAAHKAGALRRS